MPLPAPSHPTFPRRRSRRSFRNRRPPSNANANADSPPKTPAFRSHRSPQADPPQANHCFDGSNINDKTASGSFRRPGRSSKSAHASSSAFRFRRSPSQKKKDTAYANANAKANNNANGHGPSHANVNQSFTFADASFGSLRFASPRSSHAQPSPSTSFAQANFHSNASSPSLRFRSSRSSAAQPPPSTAVPTPTTAYTSKSTGAFRFQSSKNAFRFKKSAKHKKYTSDTNDINTPSRIDACALINRAVRTTYVRKGVLKVLMEIDSLVQYAERDVSTVDIMARRILGIHTQSLRDVHCETSIDLGDSYNVVVQKQLQAASSLHALRMKPHNSVVKKAKTIITTARSLIDTQSDNVSNIRLSQMERTLYQTANDLVDVDTNVTVREQVLELLVLTARKRAETDQPTPSSNISSYSSRASSSSLPSHQKYTTTNNNIQQYERNLNIGLHEPAEDHLDIDIINGDDDDHDDDHSTEEKLEYVLKYQHQFQNWAPVTVKESYPPEKKKKEAKQKVVREEIEEEVEPPSSVIHESYFAEDTPSACTLIARSWKTYRLELFNTIAQLKRLKAIRGDLRAGGQHLATLIAVDSLTNETLLLLGQVESLGCESLKLLAETYITELYPLLKATKRSTSASIITRAVNGYRIRAEQLAVTLLRIETIVTGATKRNTEQGYRDALERLAAIEARNSNNSNNYSDLVQRALKAAKLKLNGTRRIEELRTIARKCEAEQRDREAVETKAQEWITWWTDYGIARKDLRLLLATLHRILPGFDVSDNVLEIQDPGKIRSVYRKALLHVHPDRLSRRKLEAFEQVMAQKIFVELQEAYNFFVENELAAGGDE